MGRNTLVSECLSQPGSQARPSPASPYPTHSFPQEWRVNVLSSDVSNARCKADGTILLYTGLIRDLFKYSDSTEEAMAGLLHTLLHEMGHHVFRHGVRAAALPGCSDEGLCVLHHQ